MFRLLAYNAELDFFFLKKIILLRLLIYNVELVYGSCRGCWCIILIKKKKILLRILVYNTEFVFGS